MGLGSFIKKAVKGVAGLAGAASGSGWIGPAISVAGSLLGGKGGGSTSTRINFEQLRADAEKAGFNPLTALMATGGAGNTRTTAPTLSSGEFLARAVDSGYNTWSNQKQMAMDQAEQNLRMQAYKSEIAETSERMSRTRNANAPMGSSIPMYDATNQTLSGTAAVAVTPKMGAPRKLSVSDGSGIDRAPIENARQFDEDVWSWAIDGTALQNIGGVINRQLGGGLPAIGISPQNVGKGWRKLTRKPKFAMPDPRRPVPQSRAGEFPGAW